MKLSLETHLFFGRIMKEHSLFLLAGFPEGEMEMRKQADWLRKEFEDGLKRTVQLSDGVVGESILESGEIVTEFTHKAEQQTERLAGIPIDSRITEAEQKLRSGCRFMVNQNMVRNVRMLNRRMLSLVNGLIEFKERILREVKECRLYTSNYPLLVEHILREARLYRSIISELEQRGRISSKDLRETEMFWNQIMMEHAQFIRGLLDPTECELIETAEGFAKDYRRLLKEAKEQDMRALEEMTKRSIRITKDYQQFKSAGTAGIVGCQIRSVILPLLADHVLREANHYLRILEV
ncbi:DUF2935 domain-containing protein [Roseburia hominis]